MTTISLDAQKAMYATETGDYPIFLLTLHHSDLTEDILISTDATQRLSMTNDENVVYGTISRSREYFYCPMEISWLTEEEEAAPQTKLTVSNVGRELVNLIRTLRYSPTLTMTRVLASDTDQIEGYVSGLKFSDVDINTLTITGTLTLDIMTNEPFPFRTFTPSTASGIFKS